MFGTRTSGMRIVFMGTPEFAVPSLRILCENDYSIVSVVTVPDKPAGRGQHVSESPVKRFASERGIPTLQPATLSDPEFIRTLTALQPDVIVVVAFRILPETVFTIPRLGAFNLHASLLPKYRGAAPINWALIRGERETGVTTFFLNKSVDTGAMIMSARVPIGTEETAGELYDKLSGVGAEIVLHTVRLIEAGKAMPKPQDDAESTPAPKIFKEHRLIDWTKDARAVHNLVRGLSPKPGAITFHDGVQLKIYRTKLDPDTIPPDTPPGTVLEMGGGILVATGNGGIEVLELQQEGKRRLTTQEFLRGYQLEKNSVLK